MEQACVREYDVKIEFPNGSTTMVVGVRAYCAKDAAQQATLNYAGRKHVVSVEPHKDYKPKSIVEVFGGYYLTISRDDDGAWTHAMHENLKDAAERRTNESVNGASCAIFKLVAL